MSQTNSEWKCYEKFPDLSKAKLIAFDCETKDPHLLEKGPGTIRKDGYIIGFSMATDDGFRGYYPIRHASGNLPDIDKAIRWLRAQLGTQVPKVGANILYDAEWAKSDLNIDIKGLKYDVQVADPLLDENYSTYRLDAIAERRLGIHKDEELLYKAGVEVLGHKSSKRTEKERRAHIIGKVKGDLWRLPASLVGPYGEADAVLPIEIFKLQEKELREQGLWDLFILETEILDLLLAMRFQGVPVDISRAEQVRDQLKLEYDTQIRNIRRRVGFEPDIWAADSLEKICTTLGLPYLKTEKDNPSFTADWMEEQEHPIFKMLVEARRLDRGGSVFIDSKIIDMAINGRIYPSFWQVKHDRGGTVPGRFSSSNPNGQQFPKRKEKMKKLIRGLLVAEPGCDWGMFDYSQQEPRVTVHYASLLNLPGAMKARDQYRNNPDTDYHQMVSDWTEIERKTAKNINLGLAYGMGAKKFATKYGKTMLEARQLYALYHEKLPFIRALSDRCERIVKQRGYIRTLMGRHRNFNLYGPPRWKKGIVPKRKEAAIKEFGLPVMQYFTYRAMNSLIQGGSADMIKQAMVNCHKAGYIPNLTVHDELDFATINESKQIKEIKEIMLHAIELEVPSKVDVEIGPNWGNCKAVA
jgi:DNA polymerase I-like protein with 3'-5' exonuclease and polymerase domains